MLRVRLAAVPLLAGLLPLTAGALGLGEIQLRSALNQPFVADIPVTVEATEELSQLSVQLAPVATFERFGLDRPRFLEDLKFQVQQNGARTVVHVTSIQPVSEPFVSLLLDVGWPQGRLLREYTVLLDPPSFAQPGSAGQQGARAAITPPAAAGPTATAPAIQRAMAAPDAAPNSGSRDLTGSVTKVPGGDTYGPVRSNETLWAISNRLRPDNSVSLNQMMVALYRANPEAFAGNINRLRRGAILRVPRGAELDGISGRSATSEVRRQDDEWRSAGPAAKPARLQLVPPAEQPAGKAPGTGTGTAAAPGNQATLERELAENRRLLSVKDSQLKALQDRVQQLEGSPPAVAGVPAPPSAQVPSPVAEGPVESPPTEQVPPTDQTTAEPAAPPVSGIATAPESKRTSTAKRPAGKRDTGGSFFGALGDLVFNGWFLVSAAVVLLAGLFAVFARRRMASAEVAPGRFGNELRSGAVGGAGGTQPVARREDYSVEEVAADRTQSTPALGRSAAARDADRARDAGDGELPLERTISTEGAVELDQADIVAEADFHMAYGLYDQAAELLTRALRDSPDRRDLRLKLIEVYFIWENKSAFLKEAQTFQRQLKGAANPDWNKVVIMGKQICPGESLFAGAVATTGDVGLDLALADDGGAGVVDISFDEEVEAGLDFDLTGARQSPSSDLLDFDPGSPDDTSMLPTEIGPRGSRTAEVPTVEARFGDGDYSPTMETPTIESRGLEVPTMEAPTVEAPAGGTLETPTLESAVPGLRPDASDARRHGSTDQTEEINLEDLGLDLTGLDAAAGDLGTGLHSAIDGDAGDAANDADVLDLGSADDEASDLLQGLELDSTAEMRGMARDEGTLDLPAFGNALQKSAASRDIAGDTAEHQIVEDTAEQPRAAGLPGGSLGEASGELSKVDFDIGDDAAEDLEPTSVMTARRRGPEGPTMTEVGTKLDLARAYVDMGDPDGARSILNEVLEEGDSAQRQEARRLLDDLTD